MTKLAHKPARRKPAPVTVTRCPVTRCQECGQPVLYEAAPGAAAAALTAHYVQAHAGQA